MAEGYSSPENSSSSDDDSLDDTDNNIGETSIRSKRSASSGIAWCGVETQTVHKPHKPKVNWPPKPEHVYSHQWPNLRPVQINQPKFGNRMQLFSRTGYNIGVYYDGIRGTQADDDLHTRLELFSAGKVGHVRIQGMLTNMYIGMDKKGRLYPEPNYKEESTIFMESLRGLYNVYLSKKYEKQGWYLGIKKSGKFKKGSKTSIKQKAVQFLPRRERFQ